MLLRHLSLTLGAMAALSTAAQAQDAPPQPDIFLFNYDADNEEDVLSGGLNVTDQPLYDNQPFFTAGGDTFLYARDDGEQIDVYEYDIAAATHTRITNTPENEYSPTPSPDNQTISMVSERNGSVWEIDRSAPDAPRWVLETSDVVEPVGYFARNFATGDVFYWSRFGINVAITDADGNNHFVMGHAVPSTPMLIPGTNQFSFVHRQTNEYAWIKAFDPETKAVRPLTLIVGTNANYTWAPDGSILQIEDNKLHRWRESSDGWEEISDLDAHGIEGGYRIAVSPDGERIAIVGMVASKD